MFSFLSHRVASLAVLLALLALPVVAQKFSLTDVKSTRVGGLAVPGARRALLFYAERPRHDTTVLRQYWLTERMQLRASAPLLLRGPYVLQGLMRSRHHLVYQFKRRNHDTLVNVVVDTLGHTVASLRERPVPRRPRDVQSRSLDLPEANGFAFVEPGPERRSRIRFRTPDMRLAWDYTSEPQSELVGCAADSSHLWLLLTRNWLSRHPSSLAVCLDISTGRELGRYVVGPPQSAWVPAVVSVGAGHELLMVGYAYNKAASRTRTGDMFYVRVAPNGQQQTERRTALARTAELRAARGGRVHWTLVQPTADAGSVRLVGETFQNSPYGAVLLRSSLSAGLLGYSVLRPRDVISLTLDTAGQVYDVRTVPLPRDRGSFVWPVYLPGRILAEVAALYQAFRFRGVGGPARTAVVLRSPQQVQTLDLITHQLAPVRTKPAVGTLDVWHVDSDFMLLYQEDAAKRTLEVERVELGPTLPGKASRGE